jgi:hypothetical protein
MNAIRILAITIVLSMMVHQAVSKDYKEAIVTDSTSVKNEEANAFFNIRKKYPRIGIEVPVLLTRCFVDVPEGLSKVITNYSGGMGHDIGAGLKIDILTHLSISSGFHLWNKIFNADYKALATDNSGNQTDVLINENGSFSYSGLYLQVNFCTKHFFIGGGFDISFSENYTCDYKIYDPSNQLIDAVNDQPVSPLINKYNAQIDMALMTGVIFKLNHNFHLKPAVEFTIPFEPLINTGVYFTNPLTGETNEVNISAFALKFGIIASYNF